MNCTILWIREKIRMPKELINLLSGHRTFIQTHNFPDADALASALGLQEFLKYYGIETTICYDGKIDKLSTKRMLKTFRIEIHSIHEILDMNEEDYIVMVDTQKYNANFTDAIGNEVACIDHHPTFIGCEYLYRDIRIVGACSSIIASYFFQENVPLNANLATALLLGIKIDTLDLTRGVTDFDIDMFAYLYKNADKEKFQTMLKKSMEFEDLQAYGAAIESIKIYNRVGFAYIPFNCPDGLVATISDFILSLNVVDIAVVYALRQDGIKFSVRSEIAKVNAGALVAKALNDIGNGGGHASMAGGFISIEKAHKFGDQIDYEIRRLFLDTLETKME